MIPFLETDRLRLRAHVAGDLDALTAMRNDPDVYRYISGQPSTREDNWRKLMASLGHWTLKSYGYWLIEEKATGDLVGEAGFGDFKREMEPSLEGTLEAGWALASHHHRKGFATEAVQAMLGWAQENYPDAAITCLIAPENTASIKMATKIGFVERCIGTYKDESSLVMDWAG